MIADAKEGRFDFIITKEISRFARNTLDSIQYTRELLSNGVAVWFQQDSINTIDDDSEMRLAIMSSLAQEESRKLSSRIRFGHAQAIKKGTVMGNSRIYGYDKDGGKLVINESEAEMVRLVYELYATGDYSTPKIEKILNDKGYRNFKGGPVSRNVLRKIIPNPKYKGYYVGNKVKVVDMFTKKQQFLHESEWEMYRDHDKVPPIVSEELWERANAIFAIRSAEVKERRTSFKTSNLFTGKLICAEHGTPFYMKTRKARAEENNPTWVCSHRIKNGKDSCPTFGIKEKELVEILLEVLDGLSSNVDALTDKYMEFLRKADDAEETEAEIKEIEAEISRINMGKDKLFDLVIDGKLSNEEFGRRNDAANIELAAKEQEIKKLTSKQKDREEQSVKVQRFRKELMRYFKSDTQELTPGMINTLVDKIQVSMSGDVMQLNIGLNTGENAHKFVGSSGYIILTI
jgi:DNA invertase Pin-like site-specific DNA recombinase